MSFDRIRRLNDRPYPGRIELVALAVLYGAYELVRGFGGEDWAAARAHTADIVASGLCSELMNGVRAIRRRGMMKRSLW